MTIELDKYPFMLRPMRGSLAESLDEASYHMSMLEAIGHIECDLEWDGVTYGSTKYYCYDSRDGVRGETWIVLNTDNEPIGFITLREA
jgi:hypothetical protein